jgi:hypothetical protein
LATLVSLGQELDRSTNLSTGERVLEWFRGHHGAGILNWVEATYYAHHKPKVGGTATLPTVAGAATAATSPGATDGGSSSSTAASTPASSTSGSTTTPAAATTNCSRSPIAPLTTGLAGEGTWTPFTGNVPAASPVCITYVRPDFIHTSLLTVVVAMPKGLRFLLVPGISQPGHGPWPTGNSVPVADRPTLVAAFNSGFRMADSQGGFFAFGRTVRPLVAGGASLVIGADGSATVGMWGRDAQMGPNVAEVRQNLSLIVDGGRPAAGIDDNSGGRWGKTLGNAVLVWRSGVGVDANGNLLYAGGDGLSVRTLAETLIRAGAVRAMELDINHDWVTYNVYTHQTDGSLSGRKLLVTMHFSGNRYLSPDDRDFVAVLAGPS